MPEPSPPPPNSKQHIFQPPNGTRDLYPVEAARRRYIIEAWRRVSINHGFEEIDGPTFEHLDLYKVKSGEGIVSELFSFTRAGGEKDYALRPEFTPTLARMYAAKAASLPKPTKWFSVGPYFRAERPQRGRLREFLQWNADVIGDQSPAADAEVIACCIDFLCSLGLSSKDVKVQMSDRRAVSSMLLERDVAATQVPAALKLIDASARLPKDEFARRAAEHGLSDPIIQAALFSPIDTHLGDIGDREVRGLIERAVATTDFDQIGTMLSAQGYDGWWRFNFGIVRGLAYYTGMVFEVIVDGERAVAGGGRYDNLIELFGGPSTPAVGFGMGDVVLANVLQDKGLMPTDAELLGLAGQHPDAFVISNGTPEADAALPKVLADLRRSTPSHGSESRATTGPATGLHARRSYKTTKNFGKLLQEAAKSNARFAVIIESATEASIKDLATNQQDQSRKPLTDLAAELRKRLGR